jgi:hypothetical protein
MMSTRLEITVKLFYLSRKKNWFLYSLCHYCFITEHYCTITLSTKEKNDVVAGHSLTFNKHVSIVL